MKAVKILLPIFVICTMVTMLFTACMKEEDYYKKGDVDLLVSMLEDELNKKASDNEAKVNALKAEYEAKVAKLEAANAENSDEIDALTATYNSKVTELEAADKATADALAALETQYAADLKALTDADAANTAAIEALDKAYTDKVAELEAADKATADALAALETQYAADLKALTDADAANTAAIEALNKAYTDKVAELEAADKATADALAALEAEYAADLKALTDADAANTAAIEALDKAYTDKVAELEAADKATADALAALRDEYEAEIATLNAKIAKNTDEIAKNNNELQDKIDALANAHTKDIERINALLASLQSVDEANESRIEELEAQVKELLTVVSHTVIFDLNGANTYIAPATVAHGEKVSLPTVPTRENYTFLGWYVGDEKWSFVGDTVTNDMTLTAKWISSKILSIKDNCTIENDALNILVKYTDGYIDIKDYITFDDNCTVSLYKNSEFTGQYPYCRMTGLNVGNNEAVLVIEFSEKEYTVYDVNVYAIDTVDFKSGDEVFESVAVNDDLTVNVPLSNPTSTREGYEFSHWAVNGSEINFPYPVSRDTVLEAIYAPIVYTITYNANGGTMPISYTTSYTVESGASLPIPTRSLYLFDGWYSTADFIGSKVESIAIGEFGNVVLYAKWLSATNGITLELNNGSYTVTGYEGSDTAIVIPDSVDGIKITKISNLAFKNKQRITSITIPDSVTNIGNSAFEGCISLTSVTIPDSVTSIGIYAFSGCTSLTSVTIPDSVTSIGNSAFRNCTSLTSVTIPDSVTSIGDYAFEDCDGLTSVTIPDSVTSIGNFAFYSCDSLTSVVIPDSVTSIGNYAFYSCDSLTSVVIPDSVTSIGDGAFDYCDSLTRVYITDIAKWCGISFDGYSSNPLYDAGNLYLNGELVTDLVIPDSVTKIGNYAFCGCTSLTSVTIPDSVTSIGDYAFSGCTSLTRVTIGDGVTSIGYEAFYGCTSLYVVINNSNLLFEIGSTNNGYVSYYAKVLNDNGTIKYANDGYEYILTEDGFLFDFNGTTYRLIAYCGSEQAVTLPDSVNGERYEIYRMRGVRDIVIPGSVTSIGSSAFEDCTSLMSVTIGDSVTSIGQSAFRNCTSLTIYCEAASKPSGWDYNWNYSNRPAVWGYTGSNGVTDDGLKWASVTNGIAICGYSGTNNEIAIPEKINGIDVVLISQNAFRGNTTIASVTIPDSVTSIGYYAFYGCTSLTSVTIPDSVTSIGSYAFSNCTGLTSVTIPDSVTSIGDYAFRGCTSLVSVTIGDSVTSIGQSAFRNCTSLTSVTIGDGVTSIGSYAFRDCTSLTIYCKATSKPTGWNSNWNYSNCPVVWGYKG